MANEQHGKQRDLIAELSVFLREHGELILTGRKKLSLTSRALSLLNHGFSQISDSGDFSTSFEVLPTDRTQIPMFADLQFLYDFVQKAIALKVIHGNATIQGSVNIASFRMLKSLDINKVPLHLVIGIQKFRSQLETLICTRCLQSLQELYEGCGCDRSNPMSWPALTTSSVAHNNLHELDTSLRLLPAITMFDASHNSITTTERHLEYLTYLSWLSLAFNSLQRMPTFSLSAKSSMKTLILRHNCLDNINGVEDLVNLTELDVGYNCLDTHNNLEPLRNLHKLNKMVLVGNPIQTLTDHRKKCMTHISPVAAKKLLLDGKPISEKELKMCKISQPIWHNRPLHSTPLRNNAPINAPSGIEFSVDSIQDDGDGAPLLPESDKKRKGKGKKSRRVRNVMISDQEDAIDTTSEIDSITCPSGGTSYSSKSDHIQIKEKMEEARRHLGSDWLQVTVDRSRRADIETGDIGPDGTDECLDEVIRSHESETKTAYPELSPVKNVVTSGAKSSPETDIKPASQTSSKRGSPDVPSQVSQQERSTEPASTVQSNGHLKLQRSRALAGSNHIHDPDMVKPLLRKTESEFVDSMWKRMEAVEHVEDLGEESDPFIVHQQNEEEQQYILSVTDRYILEKDLNGYVFEKLDLSCLLGAERVKQSPGTYHKSSGSIKDASMIKMMFNHVKRNKKERTLVMEDEHSLTELLNILEPTLQANKIEAKIKDQLQCLKCQAQFSKRSAHKMVKESSVASNLSNLVNMGTLEEVLSCPKCNSTMLIELDLQGSTSQGPSSTSATPVFGTPLATSSAITSPCKNGDNNNIYSKSIMSEPSPSFKSINSSSQVSTENVDASNNTPTNIRDSSDSTHNNSDTFTSSKYHTPKTGVSTGQLRETEENFSKNQSSNSFHSLASTQSTKKRSSFSSADSDILVLSKNTASDQDSVFTSKKSEDSDITLIQSSQAFSRASIESDISVIGQDSNVKVEADNFKPNLDSLPESSPCGSLTKSTLNSMVNSMYEKSLSVTNSESTIVVKPGSSVDILQPRAASEQNFPTDESPSNLRLSPEGAAAVPPSETSSFKSAESGTFKSLESAKQFRRARKDKGEDRDKIEFDYSNFNQVDHRLRLYLDMGVFNDDEEFCLILRCSMSRYTKPEETQIIIVVSNIRLFIFAVNGREVGDNISKWLRLLQKENLTDLQYVDMGLGYQTFRLEFGKEDNCFKFLVRDESVCKQFVAQLTSLIRCTAFSSGSKLQGITKNNPETLQALTEQVLGVTGHSDDTDMEILKYVLGFMTRTNSKGKKKLHSVGVLVTSSHICLCEENHQWPRPRCLSAGAAMRGQQFTLHDRQTINNIASIELYEDRPKDLKIDFFNEEESTESSWCVSMETEAELLALLTSVREPWESAFGIELQINTVQVDS